MGIVVTGKSETDALLSWALPALAMGQVDSNVHLIPVSGDASSRRYFRVGVEGEVAQSGHILVDSPPATEKNAAFIAIRETLNEAGIRVPGLIAADLDRGYMLLEDLGDALLLPLLNDQTADTYYDQAFEILLQLAGAGESAQVLPAYSLPTYDEALLREELSRFTEWFVEGLLGYSMGEGEHDLVGQLTTLLISSALAQPKVFVHRDFHSRNLMLTEEGDLALIDFQDAVLGPVTYDLVSLLRDCYVKWPDAQVRVWVLKYREILIQQSGLDLGDEAQFVRWFDHMGLQRHLKVLGTFARLYLRDGKTAYLNDLPMVIEYVLEVLQSHSEEEPVCAEFALWFTDSLSPLIKKQPWSHCA